MTRVAPGVLRHALVLTLCAFALNLVWEYAQCSLFFIHRNLKPTAAGMLVATLGDVGLTWLAQLVLAAALKRWFWSLERWGKMTWTILMLTAVILASLIELRAISTGRWGYTSVNPVVPGTRISFIPIFQLVLLFPTAFYFARATSDLILDLSDQRRETLSGCSKE